MAIPTEPIGSIPRPPELLEAMRELGSGRIPPERWRALCEQAVRDTIQRFEATGSPVITDGEQTKPSFATYPVHGLTVLAPDGVGIPFADGHVRRLPRLTGGPFRYQIYASSYLEEARKHARVPVKQAVISASALSLLYPEGGIDDYPRAAFLEDLLREAEQDIRRCLQAGAHSVQIDFTEGRLAAKLDPTGHLLNDLVALNNRVLQRFSPEERTRIGVHTCPGGRTRIGVHTCPGGRTRIGVHTCPGGDRDSTHSADVDYAQLLPALFQLSVGRFYIQLASERDRPRVLRVISGQAKPAHRIFVGVIDPIDPAVETPEQVRDRVLEAAEYLPPSQLGTTDDCGFSPFADDVSTSRETAFEKIRARVVGTDLAARSLGL